MKISHSNVVSVILYLSILYATKTIASAPLTNIHSNSIDIRKFVNRGFRDNKPGDNIGGWTDQGNDDLRNIQYGQLIAANVPFNIINPDTNNGKAVIALRKSNHNGFTNSITIPVNAKCNQIYLLHTAAWLPGGEKAGSIIFKYDNNLIIEENVVAGKNIADWKSSGFVTNAVVVPLCKAQPGHKRAVGFVSSFQNPYPDRIVKNIVLKGPQRNDTIWLILGITIGRGSDIVASYLSDLQENRDFSNWFPFRITNCYSQNAAVNLSFLLDAPAGKHGFLQSKDGHFIFEDGTRGRFMGTNIHADNALFPSHTQAERVAATLARYGINIVRFHLCESVLINTKGRNIGSFVGQDKLEKWDYFIKCLRDKGVYIMLDSVMGLSARRAIPSNIKIPDFKDYYGHRPWSYFAPELIELGTRYMEQFLTRKNIYTGKSLIEEPAVAMLMLINEQTIFFDWKIGTNGISDYYRNMLQKQYNQWLIKKFKGRAQLEKEFTDKDGFCSLLATEDPANNTVRLDLPFLLQGKNRKTISEARLRNTVAFLKEVQSDFYIRMKKHLLAMGCKVPIGGSNIIYDTASLETMRHTDYTCQNVYFNHVKKSKDGKSLYIENTPLVDINLRTNKKQLIGTTIAAVKLDTLPATSTESDIMWPNDWRASYFPAIASVAALQDWDAIFHFAYMGGYALTMDDIDHAKRILFPTMEFNDPALIGLIPTASLMFLRGDISPARNLIKVVYSKKDRFTAGKRLRTQPFPFNYLTYVSKVEGSFNKSPDDADLFIGADDRAVMKFDDNESVTRLDAIMKNKGILSQEEGFCGNSLVSDTGEVIRDWGNSLLIVNTACTQGFSGFPAKPVKLQDVTIDCKTLFASIFLSSLDGKPISNSKRILLTAVGRAQNSNDITSYGEKRISNSGKEYGGVLTCTPAKSGHVVVEPINATIKLHGNKLTLTPLNPDMSRKTIPSQCQNTNVNSPIIIIGKPYKTIWYLLERNITH